MTVDNCFYKLFSGTEIYVSTLSLLFIESPLSQLAYYAGCTVVDTVSWWQQLIMCLRLCFCICWLV